MIITKIEPFPCPGSRRGKSTKYWIYLDEEPAFCLYDGDLRRYRLVLEGEVSWDVYCRILEETVIRRARQKTMALLKRSDKTECELRSRLKMDGYPKPAIDAAIEYVKGYRYIDDEKYVRNYIGVMSRTKSAVQIKSELRRKGISQELIESCTYTNIDEAEAIQKAIRRKTPDITRLSYTEKQKVAAYLFRKGFKQETIRKFVHLDADD